MTDNQPPAAQPVARYTIEPHGDAYALYAGRDNQHHGYNLARISEASPNTLALIQHALNASCYPDPRIAEYRSLLRNALGALAGDFEINPRDVRDRIAAALKESGNG